MATHVCSEWRVAALSSPPLWKHVEFYTTRHSLDCQCIYRKRQVDFERGHAPGWEKHSYPVNYTNITAADVLLSRSRELDLHVTVFITPCRVLESDLVDLAYSLSGTRTHRLRSLILRTADYTAPDYFLRVFPTLPRLCALSIEALPLEPGQMEPAGTARHYGAVPPELLLPELDIFTMSCRFIAPVPIPKQLHLPVHSLTLELTELPEYELRKALEVCPSVGRLTLDLGFVNPAEEQVLDDPDWWRQRTASLQVVAVSGVPETCEEWIRAAFPPTLPELSLEYALPRELQTGGGIFCDLESDIHLHVAYSDPTLSVRGVDSGGRTRRVAVRLEHAPLRENLVHIFSGGLKERWKTVTAVTSHASLWPRLVSTFPVTRAGMSFKSLRIVVDRLVRQPTASRGGLEHHLSQFPALRSLTLVCGPREVSVAAEYIHTLIHSLQLSLPLAVLELDHRLYAGDSTKFKHLAHSVSIGMYV
ncbi:hypothetical protein AURDEDRAFT_145693 [Auricularia subglabra TFB-10046 SS5]|nr:hypothetical protein AURDEDRAFT_145693 [Auricularia subglabra TFB-10046 SS5]